MYEAHQEYEDINTMKNHLIQIKLENQRLLSYDFNTDGNSNQE